MSTEDTMYTEVVSDMLCTAPSPLITDSSTVEESISGRKNRVRAAPRPLNFWLRITATNRLNTRMMGT